MSNRSDNDVILIGYSSHALVVAEALILSGYIVIGYLERDKVEKNLLNLYHVGFEHDINVLNKIKGIKVFPGMGDNIKREKVFVFLEKNGFEFPSVIHPQANVTKQVKIGKGTIICRGANINPFVKIGKGVIINTGAIIEHECIIDDYTHIAPGAVLAGNVKVNKGSFIGANAVIKQGIIIGKNVTVGAGSVVVKNVENNMMVVGNPAKQLKNE